MNTLQMFQSGTSVITTRRVQSINNGITLEQGTLCTVQLQFEDGETREPLLNLAGKMSAFPADAFEALED